MKIGIKRGKAWILSGLFMLSLVSGCKQESQDSGEVQESGQESKHEESRNEESRIPEIPQEGGSLSMAIVNPDTFNPLLCSDEAARQMLNLIFSPVVEMDEKGEARPCLAKSWQWEGNKLILQLDTNAHYHDGTSVTAADVVYSISVIQQAEQSPYKNCVAEIRQAQATSVDTVALTFQYPGEAQIAKLCFPVLSRTYYSSAGADTLPMGSGPYRVYKHLRSRELQLVKNENYFRDPPYITGITVYLTHVTDSVAGAFEAGKTNLFVPEDTAWGLYENRNGLTLHGYDSGEGVQLIFNMQSKSLTQADMRRGIALCIDSEALLKEIHWNHGISTENFLWPNTGKTVFLGYDPEAGRAMIKKIPEEELVLAVFKNDELIGRCARMVMEQLTKEGLTVKLREIEENTEWQKETWDLLLLRRTNNAAELSAQLGSQGQENYGGYRSETIDNLLEKEIWIDGIQTRLQEYLSEELPVYTLFYLEKAVMTGKNVQGNLTPTAWNWYGGIENLYIREGEK